MLSSPRRPSSTSGSSPRQNGADGWLGGYPGPFSPRCPVCACLLVSSWLPNRATMSQVSSLTQSGHSVRQAMTAYTLAQPGAGDLIPAFYFNHTGGLPRTPAGHRSIVTPSVTPVLFWLGALAARARG